MPNARGAAACWTGRACAWWVRRAPAVSIYDAICKGARLIVPGRSSDIRSQFELFCDSRGHSRTFAPRSTTWPCCVCWQGVPATWRCYRRWWCRTNCNRGVLQLYAEIPEIAEQFFAVTLQRQFRLDILDELLGQSMR